MLNKILLIITVITLSSCVTQKASTKAFKQPSINAYEAQSKNCLDSITKTPKTITANALFAQLEKVDFNKGEYESTGDYNKRVKAKRLAAGILPDKLIFIEKHFNPKFIHYDADTQTLHYEKHGVNNTNIDCFAIAGYGTKYEKNQHKICNSLSWMNKYFVLEEETISASEYTAQNAYGRSTSVIKSTKIQKGLLEGPGTRTSEDYIWTKVNDNSIIFSINVKPSIAKILKDNTRILIGFSLKPPYLYTGTSTRSPTIDMPLDTTINHIYASSNLQCAGIVDKRGRLLSKQALK